MDDDTQNGSPDLPTAADNRPDNFQAERALYFGEIAELKNQRNDLVRQLAECRRENRELRAQLGRGDK